MGTSVKQWRPRGFAGSVLVLIACAILIPAIFTFDPSDWPSPNQFPHPSPPSNACGVVGAWLSYQARHYLGDGVFPLLLFSTLAALIRLARGEVGQIVERAFGLALVVSSVSASAYLVSGAPTTGLLVGHGGLLGFGLGELLTRNLDRLGTVIVLTASFFVGLLFTTEGWVLRLPAIVGRWAQTGGGVTSLVRQFRQFVPVPRVVPLGEGLERDHLGAVVKVKPASRKRKEENVEDPDADDSEDVDASHTNIGAAADLGDVEDVDTENEALIDSDLDAESKDPADEADRDADEDEDEVDDEAEPIGDGSAKLAPPRAPSPPPRVKVNFSSPQQTARGEAYPRQIENWTLPSLTLLQEPEYGFNQQQEEFVREQAKVLERTLEEFRLDARVVEIDTGPVITMFELRLGAGIKVSQIASLSNDIARALKAHAVRVVAPISGKNTVGIEVPNIHKERVRLKELMTLAGKPASEMTLPLFLGKDAGGAALVADLSKMPHLLIAGTTGSGKSVCLNTVILSLLMTKRPDHTKLILVDPKMVEMTQFKEVPHLMCPLVTDVPRAAKILEWAVTKMEERYELLAEAGARNIAGYNVLTQEELYAQFQPETEEEKAAIPKQMPYVVIIIDELADLMMTSGKEVEHHLCRLAQKSRAVGIHLILATQRPEVKVVTGLIKSNMPCRICFRVASRMDSRIVLDQNGGEVLLGQGDMLFLPPGQHKLIRSQGTFLDDGEVNAVLKDLASRAQPEFHPELTRLKTGENEGEDGARDPLFDQAVRIVLQSKRGSVSLLQRRLTIGYSRASRLIEQMGEAGIVGQYKGSQAREVCLTVDEWDAMRKQMQTELTQGYAADAEPNADSDDD